MHYTTEGLNLSNKTVSVISHFHSLVKNNSVLQSPVCRSFILFTRSASVSQAGRSDLQLQMCREVEDGVVLQ